MSVERKDSAQKDSVQLCSVCAGDGTYGIETSAIREVLGSAAPYRVPLAPAYIAGAMTYRGEVLEAVSLRMLLGLPGGKETRVLVVEDSDGGRFGLMVDSVGGMVAAPESTRENNPATLEMRGAAIFNGVYRMETGLMVRLNLEKLRPAELARSAVFNGTADTVAHLGAR